MPDKHSEIAWNNFTGAASSGAPRLERFVKSLYAPVDRLGEAFDDLRFKTWLDSSEGVQLDRIGDIVGQPRAVDASVVSVFFGFEEQPSVAGFESARFREEWESQLSGSSILSDEDYRRVLYWKIAVNNGHGTGPEIGRALRHVLRAEYVAVATVGPASLRVFVSRWNDGSDPLLNTAERWVPKAAGVGLQLMLGGVPSETFGFAEQGFAGFEVGRFAQEIYIQE